MVEYKIKIHPKQMLAYFPKRLAKAFGFRLKLIPDFKAAVIFPENEDLNTVIRSLEIILQDFRLRAEAVGKSNCSY